MSHQAALSMELQASVDAFLRTGGTITKLNYAGVPIDDEYGRPVHVPARAEPAVETVEEWRVRAALPAPSVAEILEHFAVPLTVEQPPAKVDIITQLRTLRADAQRTLAQLNRLVESV